MDSKQPPLFPAVDTRRTRRLGYLKPVVLFLLLSYALLNYGWLALKPLSHSGCHRGQHHRYTGESITWKPCGNEIAGHVVECSSIDVPMDQFNAHNSGNKTFNIPLIRMRGKNATENLLLNPGGPGGSGFEFLYRRGEQLSAIVGEGFHLLSFDPRGINSSTPMASCYPDKESRRNLSPVNEDDSPEMYAWTQNLVQACADTMGEHGRHINTPQTAADMNSILDAIGQDDMIYWGFSYGTLLGQTYAGMFPERSKRVIIDGVVNQFDWYLKPADWESLVDTENVLDGFFDECFKAADNCSLSSLAKNKDELWDRVRNFALDLDEQPMSVYVNNSVYGLLDYKKILYVAIFPALYKPGTWYDLADRLTKLLNGNATEAFLAYGQNDAWDLEGDANLFVTLNDGASGREHWAQGRRALLDQIVPLMNQSIFGPTEVETYYSKQQWAIPRTHTYVPKYGVKTAHPLLILSTTYDPVCPLVSARSAQASFEGSQIVEVLGYGHCSVAVTSMCAAERIRDFLYHGKVPDNYTQCDVDGPYFVKPEESAKPRPLKHFEDEEQRRIHLAQVELARDPEWPIWK